MAFGGGYESDLNLNNVKLLGDFPIEHSLGGYGIAQMLEPDKYAVTLNPAINQYRDGTPLNIVFPETNQGSPTLNINNKGDIPLKLVSDIQLLDFLPGQILPGKVYSMIKKGDFFQVSNNSYSTVGQASETQAGKAEIATQTETNQGADDLRIVTPLKLLSLLASLVATQAEVNAGISNTKRVTPLTLAQYVSDKVTGLWDDKGLLNCTANPNYPSGQKGDAYTVSIAGKIGGVNGKAVEVRDVVYCMTDNAGGNEATVGASWNVIQSNLVQATEIISGYARIASVVEALAGIDHTTIITPSTLKAAIDNIEFPITVIPIASETVAGVMEIATQAEVNAGVDNIRTVTPQKLAQYVSDKVTGLWDDKGILDCSLNPNYPAGQKGDAYTVNIAGKIGGVNGKVVEVRDVVYCMGDNAGGNEATIGASWNVIQSNLVQATEIIAGFARIASVAEALTGIDHTTIITPSTLKAAIDNIAFPITVIPIASETVAGVMEIATQAEVNAGADNVRAVTPQKLAQYVSDKVTGLWEDKGLLDCLLNPNYPAGQKGDAYTVSVAGKIGGPAGTIVEVRDVIYCKVDNAGGDEVTVGASWNVIQGNVLLATTTIAGIAKIATQADLTTGIDDTKFITPLKLLTYLNAKKMRTQIRFQSDSLPESQVLAAGSADYHFGIIAVTGIPAGSTIRQASLSWEGYIRNDDNANPNSFDAGNFALQKDGSAFSNYINVVGKFQLAAGHVTFFRFVEDDARNLVTGNGTYLAKLGNLSALVGSLSIAGHWTLEIDYETP
jgi:citrate lyase gamma subunit